MHQPQRWRRGVAVECRIRDQEVAGSSLGRALRRKNWASFSHLCASVTKQYNLVLAWGRWCLTAGKVTAGLAESNGSLPPGLWLCMLSPAGWLPRVRDQLRSPTLDYEYGVPLPFINPNPVQSWDFLRNEKVEGSRQVQKQADAEALLFQYAKTMQILRKLWSILFF